jgi:hypothetical protein
VVDLLNIKVALTDALPIAFITEEPPVVPNSKQLVSALLLPTFNFAALSVSLFISKVALGVVVPIPKDSAEASQNSFAAEPPEL